MAVTSTAAASENRLGKNKAKVVGNLRLVPATMQRGENRWKVEPA